MYIPLLIFCIVIILIIIVLILVLRQPRLEPSLLFIHIPKNGGNAIVNLGNNNGLNWRYEEELPYSFRPPTREISLPSFCIVRDPYERIIFQYETSGSKKDLNTYISHKLKKYSEDKYINNCSFLSQHEYSRYATYILHLETLKDDFSALMEKFNLDLTLDEDKRTNVRKFKVEDISRECLDLINEVYEKDFERLSYSMK